MVLEGVLGLDPGVAKRGREVNTGTAGQGIRVDFLFHTLNGSGIIRCLDIFLYEG